MKKQLSLSGSFELAASAADTYKFLSSPDYVMQCVPGMEEFSKEADGFGIKIKSDISYLPGSMKLYGRVEETREPSYSRFYLEGKKLGSKIIINASFDLKEKTQDSTEVMWHADAELSGPLAGVPETTLRKLNEEKMSQFVENLKARYKAV